MGPNQEMIKVTKRRCKMCGKRVECREVVTGGVSRGWFCPKHYLQYIEIIERIMKRHNCDETEAEKIAESIAKRRFK